MLEDVGGLPSVTAKATTSSIEEAEEQLSSIGLEDVNLLEGLSLGKWCLD